VRMPAARLQVNFHVAGNGLLISDLQDRAAKVRAAFQTGKTRVKNADGLALRRPEFIAFEALVLPDGLQQFFRWPGIFIAERINGAAAFTPGGVKIFGADIHAPSLLRRRGQSQAVLPANREDFHFERNPGFF
jgi:hypothetical protein